MPQTLKGIKNALGRFADKFRRRTKKPVSTKHTTSQLMTHNNKLPQRMTHNNAEALKEAHANVHQAYDWLNVRLHACKLGKEIVEDTNADLNKEIAELKHSINNYDAILTDSNKLNLQLQDELLQCQGSKSRKHVSSGRRSTGPSQAFPTVGPAGQISQRTSIPSSSGRRSVKSGSRRTSKLIRSRKPALNTIPELNEPTENSSKRRARLAKQNEKKQAALNFISAHKNAYTQKRKEINNAKASKKAATEKAAADAKKAANNALRNKKLAHIGMMRHGG